MTGWRVERIFKRKTVLSLEHEIRRAMKVQGRQDNPYTGLMCRVRKSDSVGSLVKMSSSAEPWILFRCTLCCLHDTHFLYNNDFMKSEQWASFHTLQTKVWTYSSDEVQSCLNKRGFMHKCWMNEWMTSIDIFWFTEMFFNILVLTTGIQSVNIKLWVN